MSKGYSLKGKIRQTIKNRNKGKEGEKSVITTLRQLNKSDYKLLDNVLLASRGKSTQIDHIVVSKYGIFVIETKNYKGLIRGNTEATHFYQVLGNKQYSFYNPYKQNEGHIASLTYILNPILKKMNKKNIPIYSIVCFTGQVKLSITGQNYLSVLKEDVLLKRIKSQRNEVLTSREVKYLVKRIKKSSSKGLLSGLKHIFYVKRKSFTRGKWFKTKKKTGTKRTTKKNNKRCPECGNVLVKRIGKYGEFLGCSHYPKCTYTERIHKK